MAELFNTNTVTSLKEKLRKANHKLVGNKKELIKKTFRKAFLKNDIILITGGISVGDYDFTGVVLEDEKVKTVFYKVKQKPGKPLFFGVKKSKYLADGSKVGKFL